MCENSGEISLGFVCKQKAGTDGNKLEKGGKGDSFVA